MNSNTIKGYLAGSGVNQLASISLSATAATTGSLVPVNVASGTSTAVLVVPLQTDIVGASGPLSVNKNAALSVNNRGREISYRTGTPGYASNAFDGRPFKVRVAGTFSNATNTTASQLQIQLYQSTNGTTLTTMSATQASIPLAAGTGNGNFTAEFLLLWDSVSQVISGTVTSTGNFSTTNGAAANVVNTVAVLTTDVTSITSAAGLSFCVGAKLGTATGTATTQLVCQFNEFSIEEV